MYTSIRTASIDKLIDKVKKKIDSPRNQAKKERPFPKFFVGLENIGWAKLFNYHMQEFYDNPCLNLEIQLKQKLFHLRNFDDDTFIDNIIGASRGMYFEYTLFGIQVYHTPEGIPVIQEDHPLTKVADLNLLKPINFYTSGEMPETFRLYDKLKEMAGEEIHVNFPRWGRGPLDIAIHLRGYNNFILDTMERPQFIHDLMRFITNSRIQWCKEYFDFIKGDYKTHIDFLGEEIDTKGIEGDGIADDWINVPFISPQIFEEFVLPYYIELARFHKKVYWIHSCGNQTPIQKYLCEIPFLESVECGPWTNLEETIKNIPPDKYLNVGLHPTDGILLNTKEGMERKLKEIVFLCKGRKFSIYAGGLQKIHDNYEEDIEKIKIFIRVAKRVFER